MKQLRTYMQAETKKRPINWNKQLDRLATLAKISHNKRTLDQQGEIHLMITQAASWVTCACGNQCEIIPRNSVGCPEDAKLDTLGCQFYHDVSRLDVPKARKTLLAIEKRSLVLIKRIRKNELTKRTRIKSKDTIRNKT